MPRFRTTTYLTTLLFLLLLPSAQGQKPPLTIDEFFNAVDIRSVQISPDGHAVAIETSRADWTANCFRSDLWLYRDAGGGSLVELTQSGHDGSPQWSPDGRWIAFLSNREKDVAQVYVISASGGEAFSMTSGDEEVHAFAWSGDSRRLYFAIRTPLTKVQKDADAEEWKDVVRFREAERGDALFSVEVASTLARNSISNSQRAGLPVPEKLATTPYRVSQMATSPDGNYLALATVNRSFGRFESTEPYGIYVVDLPAGTMHLAVHTQLFVGEIRWSTDSRHVFFAYSGGNPEGSYQDLQSRLYWVEVAGGRAVRWASSFRGEITESYSFTGFTVMQNGAAFAVGRLGTEVQPYTESDPDAEFVKQPGWAGTYELLSAARHSPRVAFVYSSRDLPREVYLAEGTERLQQAKPITAFNKLIAERELPQGKPYRWTADDGTPVEGMLIYPPGKFEAKRLPMLTLIHGGDDAEGNDFRVGIGTLWAPVAATQGWLVFKPNYRGSTGYGDAFMLGMVPHYASRPGRDILEGVDALVKDGIADPDQLTVGGYSMGGMLTNWLITQTTRFKAAVSGAGAGVEWATQWGYTYPTYSAYLLGGTPWEAEANYIAESPIWRMDKVTTPTHIVTGSEDSSVPPFQAYLLEEALQTISVPHGLLIFPGEDHGLHKNPWHGKIKVREELKWLEKYGRKK